MAELIAPSLIMGSLLTDAHSKLRGRLRRWAVIIPGIYVFWCLTSCMIQEHFIFPRSMAGPGVKTPPRGVEPVWIETGPPGKAFRVEAWYLPPLRVGEEEAGAKIPAIVFFHGNAELIDDGVEHTRGWRERGFAVLLCEYRGYGRSGGKPSQAGIVEDAMRFYDLLAARPEVDPARIILHGRSLGGGVACQLAASRPCMALVLESSFTSVASFAWSLGVPPFLVKHPFRNDRVLGTLDRPVLILHGAEDTIVPASHGRALHAIAKRSTYQELSGGHNDFPRDYREFWGAIDEFLAGVGGEQQNNKTAEQRNEQG